VSPFALEELHFSLYVVVHWAFTLVTALWLMAIFRWRKHLFVKPSLVLIGYAHLFFQWPAALNASHFETYLPDPYLLVVAVHGTVLLGLAVAARTHDAAARALWARLLAQGGEVGVMGRRAALWLAVAAACVVGVYLSVVPFSETGLYVIWREPALAAIARESSLKLLENRALAYAFLVMASAIAPLLAVLLTLTVARAVRKQAVLAGLVPAAALATLLLAVSLTGARGFAVNLLAVVGITLVLRNGLQFRFLKVLGGLALVLAPAVMLTALREGRDVGPAGLGGALVGAVLERAFIAPLEVGSWYLHYSQLHGLLGVSAVPKLAGLLGVPAINAPNLIGLRYSPYAGELDTVSADAGYFLTYFSYFGAPALTLTVSGIWFTDVALAAYRRLDDELLLPGVAATSAAALAFISTDYTTVWVSHGFGVVLVLALIVNRLVGDRSARAPLGGGSTP
jgi:hypothetical protein